MPPVILSLPQFLKKYQPEPFVTVPVPTLSEIVTSSAASIIITLLLAVGLCRSDYDR